MTLERLRPTFRWLLTPGVRIAKQIGVAPNFLSLTGLVSAVFAAGAFYIASEISYALGAIFVLFNGIFDTLDGELARDQDIDSNKGEFIDRSLDRYADVIMITGLAMGVNEPTLGLVAVTGALLTSFIGSQAQAVGVDRIKGGLISGADRLALMIIAGLTYSITPEIYDFSTIKWSLVLLSVFGHFTSLQRLISALYRLR